MNKRIKEYNRYYEWAIGRLQGLKYCYSWIYEAFRQDINSYGLHVADIKMFDEAIMAAVEDYFENILI